MIENAGELSLWGERAGRYKNNVKFKEEIAVASAQIVILSNRRKSKSVQINPVCFWCDKLI